MRYRLRTLLIFLAVGPMVLAALLAPVLNYLVAHPELQQVARIAFIAAAVYLIVWFACGVLWMFLMRGADKLLNNRHK